MATIRKRKRKDGTYGYTVQIRIMRDSLQAYQESQTFDRQQVAYWDWHWLPKILATPANITGVVTGATQEIQPK